MNQLIHTSVPQGTLVITITMQDVVASNWQMLCGSYELFGGTKAAAVLLDLKSLQGPSGIAALYAQMADDVRSVTNWWPLPLTNDIKSSASLT
jgi:hypothetical protein